MLQYKALYSKEGAKENEVINWFTEKVRPV